MPYFGSSWDEGARDELERVRAINAELLTLARRVAEHFADTDAPLGILAAALIAKSEGRA